MKNLLVSAITASVFAIGSTSAWAETNNPKDPFENFNRSVFSFNQRVDQNLLRPVAKGYQTVVPSPVRQGVSNFFGNINDVWIGVNNLLQGKVVAAGSDAGRVVVNTTLGILGIFDVATNFGLEKHDEDFGQTLATWGVGDGPYLVLPFFGPRTLRDSAGLGVDVYTDPVGRHTPVDERNSALAVRIVKDRAELLDAESVVSDAALDPYTYLRDAYLQHRQYVIHDGQMPRSKDDDFDIGPEIDDSDSGDKAAPAK